MASSRVMCHRLKNLESSFSGTKLIHLLTVIYQVPTHVMLPELNWILLFPLEKINMLFKLPLIILTKFCFNTSFPEEKNIEVCFLASSEATKINKKWRLPSKCDNKVETAATTLRTVLQLWAKSIMETRGVCNQFTSFGESENLHGSHFETRGRRKRGGGPVRSWTEDVNGILTIKQKQTGCEMFGKC